MAEKSTSMKKKGIKLKGMILEEVELQNKVWMSSVRVTLSLVGEEASIASIYSVPNKLRNSNNDAYSPHVVSIGPIHRLKDCLLPMQSHKWSYMYSLFERTSDPEKCLEKCSKAMLRIDMPVRSSYAGRVALRPHELAEIMLVDGCFLLQLFMKFADSSSISDSDSDTPQSDGEDDDGIWDPLFNNNNNNASGSNIISSIRHDLTLFENQIPLFVLNRLFDVIKPCLNDKEKEKPWYNKSLMVMDLAYSFFSSPYFCSIPRKINKNFSSSKNFLDIFHKSYFISRKSKPVIGYTKLKFCAREIQKAGIKFKIEAESKGKNLLKISFCKQTRVVKIPPLEIQETTVSFFRNLIALEQCSEVGNACYFTSYAFFLRDLICSPSDIDLLKQKGIIIINNLKNQNESDLLINLFQGITKGIDDPEESCFGVLCHDLNASVSPPWWCLWRWHRCLECCKLKFWDYYSILLREYCPHPWRITQIFAAFLVLVFTGLQTFYTLFSS